MAIEALLLTTYSLLNCHVRAGHSNKNKGIMIMKYFVDAFRKYADFSGRATRTQYWMFVLIFTIIYLALALVDTFLGTYAFALIFNLALLIPYFSINARRLHDTGRTGWWQLIVFLPLIGFIVLLVFYVQDSHEDNEYGPNPKAAYLTFQHLE